MSADTPRTLYLHTGTWKTGSTALQAHLNLNSARLAAAGLSYESLPNSGPWEGNGNYLSGKLLGPPLPSDSLVELLEMYFAGRQAAICSSETFTSFGSREWQQLLDAASQLDVRVRTITYLRDVAPYYQSMHAQAFKSGEHYCDLATFCQVNLYATVMKSVRSLLEHFGRGAMTVIHYESARAAIDAPFLAAVHLKPDHLDRAMLAKKVNRSLTSYEMNVLRRMIEKTGQQFANDLANLLLRRRPDLECDYVPDLGLLEQLKERHRDDLQWINEMFFAGAQVARIAEPQPVPTSERQPNDKVEQAIDRDLAEWCMARLASMQDEAVAFVAGKMANVDWGNIGNPALPPDFDPLAYLILNIDVLKAGVPPCAHYLTSGHNNEGRRWRWETR